MSGYYWAGLALCLIATGWAIIRPASTVSKINSFERLLIVALNLGLGFLFLFGAVHL